MRVIAGRYGGRRLQAPAGAATRPTSDRVRESLFSMLGPLDGLHVLDLFAGSGALAIEALSRGAASAVCVDTSEVALRVLRANLRSVGAEAQVVRRPALAQLNAAISSGSHYDLVFLDPPYRLASTLGPLLSAPLTSVLAPEARVVAESDRRAPLELGLDPITERRFGDTLIRIFRGP